MLETATTASTERARTGAPAYAALDLGTNNCRLLVATPAADGFRVLDSFSRIVRLGEGLHQRPRPAAAPPMGRISSCACAPRPGCRST
jgi:exopolyphosphatase/guanosine-5'-triphosphate,3'-diphosphate pyrophosphatase